jgi:outer membrane usher protein FimD/PapC
MPRCRLRGAHLRLALIPLVCAVDIPDACANENEDKRASTDVEFDTGMLKLRGIDPDLAEYFRSAARFTAGRHRVALRVNGRSVGQASATFDEAGSLCVDEELMEAAELRMRPESAPGKQSHVPTCVDMTSIYPAAIVELDPARGEVSLLVPTDAQRVPEADTSGYARGGAAALLNYDIIGLHNRSGSHSESYWSASTEAGFNAGDWIVRSRQVSTASDGRHRMEVLDTYAQRSFAAHRAVLQLGELNLANPALSGGQVIGVQVASEDALATQGGGANVEGFAHSQARIEVRQDGVLIYSTVVPAGAFTLTNLPRLNRHTDLEVIVVGADGQTQRFTVTAAMAGSLAPATGYTLGIGRMRNAGASASPWVVSGGWSGGIRRDLTLSSGAVLATDYQALGAGFGMQPASGTQVQLDVATSRATREHATGMQGTLTLSRRLNDAWATTLSHSRQSPGFRQLLDTASVRGPDDRRSRYRDQSSASLSWSRPGIGTLSVGYSRSVVFDGGSTTRALASWGTRLGPASVSLSAEWGLSRTSRGGGNSVYLSLSVPLGDRRRLATNVRQYAGETRYGASLSEQVNDFASYRAGAEYRESDRRGSFSAAVALLPRYFQLDAGHTRDVRSSNTNVGLRGGLVWHGQGLTASPYAVRDTFGVLSVGDAAGVRISTPAGPVWTDAGGRAVVAQLSPYGKSNIEISTDSLPRNVDVKNGAAVVEAARGAVTTVSFGLTKTRRVLVRARTRAGVALPPGASVTNDQDELVDVVQADGEIFVPNALATPRLWVSGREIARCEIDISKGRLVDKGNYYDLPPLVCRPVEGGEP